MKTTWWDIKTPVGWTEADYDMQRFFNKLGNRRGAVYKGYAYLLVYNEKRPSKSVILKAKM